MQATTEEAKKWAEKILTTKQWEVYYAYVFECKKYREIAEERGISVVAAWKLKKNAEKHLRNHFKGLKNG